MDMSEIDDVPKAMLFMNVILKSVGSLMLELQNHVLRWDNEREKRDGLMLIYPVFDMLSALVLATDEPEFYEKFIKVFANPAIVEFINASREEIEKKAAMANLPAEVKNVLRTKPVYPKTGS